MKQVLCRHLTEKIIPFWTQLLDKEAGGFFGFVSCDKQIDQEAPKGLVQQARFLWSFSALENHFKNHQYQPYADHAFQFLKNHLYQKETEAFHWLVTRKGKPIETRIITYGQCFAIYALSEYYLSTQNQEALDLAMASYRRIEEKAFDPIRGGYIEEFDSAWNETPCDALSDHHSNVAFTANTMIHMLEAILNLYRAFPDERIKKTLYRVIGLLTGPLMDPSKSRLWMYVDQSFQPLVNTRHYGHEIEFSWLLQEVLDRLQVDNPDWVSASRQIGVSAIDHGWNGRFLKETDEQDPSDHVWWVASEALVGLWTLYQKTNDRQYLNHFHTLFQSIQDDLVDPDPDGEWFWSKANSKGGRAARGMCELWKTPYHNTRAFLKLMERM